MRAACTRYLLGTALAGALAFPATLFAQAAVAAKAEENVPEPYPTKANDSPYAGRIFPSRLSFGDTHLPELWMQATIEDAGTAGERSVFSADALPEMSWSIAALAPLLALHSELRFSMFDQPAADGTEPAVEVSEVADLAKQLANPIASLISVPIQNNFDFGGGPKGDGFRYSVDVRPVIPFSIGEDWNLISRTIIPYVYQKNIFGTSSQSGLSDTIQSLFFSPKAPTSDGWIWGAGPVLLLPTATDDLLGTEKWGAGPTAVALKQDGPWTYGALVNHIWSFAGDSSRQSVNSTFLQPFLSYTTEQQTTFDISTESSYDWANHQWTVPLIATVAQLVTVGETPVQFSIAGKYYAATPDNGPEWGLRFQITLLFP